MERDCTWISGLVGQIPAGIVAFCSAKVARLFCSPGLGLVLCSTCDRDGSLLSRERKATIARRLSERRQSRQIMPTQNESKIFQD